MAANTSAMAATREGTIGWRRFWMLVQANLLMYTRERVALFWVIIFPVGLMLLFGSIFGHIKINPADPNSLTVISFMVPGLIVLMLMSNGLVGNAEAMAVYRERGILQRVQTTPLPVWQFLLARIVMQVPVMVALAFVMVGISVLVFNARYSSMGLVTAIPALVFGALLFIAMGQTIAALVRKSQTANLVASAVNLPLMFLGGLWIQMSDLPEWLQAIAKYLPSAVVADIVRAPMLSDFNYEFTNLPLAISWLCVLSYLAIAVGLSARFFKWDRAQSAVGSEQSAVEPTRSAQPTTHPSSIVHRPSSITAGQSSAPALRRFGLLLEANVMMLVRSRDYVFWVVVFPILLMLLFGTIWGNSGDLNDVDGLTFIVFLTPGLIVLSLISNGLPGRAETMALYRERGILRRVQATPLPVWQMMTGETLVHIAVLIGQVFLMVGVSALVFNAHYDLGGVLAAIPAVVLGALVFMSLGTMVAALVKKVQSANAVAMAIMFPLMFLGNLWTPVAQFPEPLQAVSNVLPSTMAVELVRVLMLAGIDYVPIIPLWTCLLGLLAYLAVASFVSARFFKWS